MKTQLLITLFLLILSIALQCCGKKEAEQEPTTIVFESTDEDESGKPDKSDKAEESDEKEEPRKEKKGSKTKDAKNVSSKPLTLVITNLRSADAPVMVGLYDANGNFPNPDGSLKEYKFIPVGNTLTAQITDRKFGEYAMAIYQDENSSGAIDKNAIGIPKEGYCFSNNYRPKIKAPSFKDAKFNYDEKSNTVTMEMVW